MTTDVSPGDSAPVHGLLGTSRYARSKKDLMAMVNEVRALGAAVEVDLPTIVAIGNQSSGKSSLIEALSGIQLPRDFQTCTRVPIEVRLRQEDVPWNCVIKIRFIDPAKPEAQFGAPIMDVTLVEPAIRRAQLAALNPAISIDRFLNYDFSPEAGGPPPISEYQFAFAENVVVLEVTGPNETDLTLVDLPGLIQNVKQGEDEASIVGIQNMVKSYISRDCLILLVITMKEDPQTQQAIQFATDIDPEGIRTIGVLTKADTVSGRVETDHWLDMLRNRKMKLTHGYFRTSDELAAGISSELAKANEESFFRDGSPWEVLDHTFKKRLGTRNLASFLSGLLSKFIEDRLEMQIGNRSLEIARALKLLGKPPTEDPTSMLLGLVTAFGTSLAGQIEGQADHDGFMRKINKLDQAFVEAVYSTTPVFIPTERANGGPGPAVIVTEDTLGEMIDNPNIAMYLDDMRLHIECCRTRELPMQIPRSALDKLIKRSISTWGDLSSLLLEAIRPVIKALLAKLTQDIFGQYEHGGLPSAVNAIIANHLDILFNNTRALFEKFVALEGRPRTLNEHYLIASQRKYFAALKERRSIKSETFSGAPDGKEELNGKVDAGGKVVAKEDPTKLDPTDEYDMEMKLMAESLAYWKVAFKRVIDNIPRVIDMDYLTPLANTLRAALLEELQVFGDGSQARCRELLSESPDIAEQRNDLNVRKVRLDAAQKAIKKFKFQ